MQRKNMIERKQSPEQKGRTILRNILNTVGIMGAATIVCLALQHFAEADTHVPLLFVLAVVMAMMMSLSGVMIWIGLELSRIAATFRRKLPMSRFGSS